MKRIILAVTLILNLPVAYSAIATPSDSVLASNIKRNQYHRDGIIWGGDALANPMVLENIRWAPNAGFERIVVDLAGEGSGWETKIPPYFQIGVAGGDKKILVSIRGIARRKLSAENLAKSLARSSLVSSTYMAPPIEGDLASFEIQLNKPVAVESFYLVNPPRIIMDIRAEK